LHITKKNFKQGPRGPPKARGPQQPLHLLLLLIRHCREL